MSDKINVTVEVPRKHLPAFRILIGAADEDGGGAGWRILSEAHPTDEEEVERAARAIYASLGFEEADPWDAASARRDALGMDKYTANQTACFNHARAALNAIRNEG